MEVLSKKWQAFCAFVAAIRDPKTRWRAVGIALFRTVIGIACIVVSTLIALRVSDWYYSTRGKNTDVSDHEKRTIPSLPSGPGINTETAPERPLRSKEQNITTELTEFFDKLSNAIKRRDWKEVYDAYDPDFSKSTQRGTLNRETEISLLKQIEDITFRFNGIKSEAGYDSLVANVLVDVRGDTRLELFSVIRKGNKWKIIGRPTD